MISKLKDDAEIELSEFEISYTEGFGRLQGQDEGITEERMLPPREER